MREKEKQLRKEEAALNDKEHNISAREITVSEQLQQIESRQKIIEKKENMIREMSQLMLNQEMQSTRELNFHTKRYVFYFKKNQKSVYDGRRRAKIVLE